MGTPISIPEVVGGGTNFSDPSEPALLREAGRTSVWLLCGSVRGGGWEACCRGVQVG